MRKLILHFFSVGSLKRDVAVLALGSVLSQGINLITMPVVSRLFGVADFGVLMMYLGVSTVLATAATGRYEAHIVLPKDEEEARVLLYLSMCLILVFSLLCLTIVILLTNFAINWVLDIGEIGLWLYWIPLSIVFIGTAQALINWHSRRKSYKLLASNRVVASIIIAVISVSLGWCKVTGGLLIAAIVGQAGALLLLFWRSGMGRSVQLQSMLAVAKSHQKAPQYLFPAALLDLVTQQLPLYMIGILFSVSEAGQYGMAWKVLALPSALIGAAAGQVFYQRFAAIWPDQNAAKRLLFRTWKYLAFIGFMPLLLVLIWGESIFNFVLGEQWSHAGKMASAMTPMLFVMFVSSPTSGIYLVLGLQSYSLCFGVGFILYRTISFVIGWYLNSILIGLWCWVIMEIIVIVIYNTIAIKTMGKA